MKLIKLNAIDSTNDFLKALHVAENLESFTVVTAESQTKGKGQRGAVWNSQEGKNLISSILVKDFVFSTVHLFDISIITSLAVVSVLQDWNVPELSIKWPNDIMAGNKKIGGILIENIVKSDENIHSIIGIGLNVNQMNFENLPKASSLALICQKEFDKSVLPELIVSKMKNLIASWTTNANYSWQLYLDTLFKKNIPMAFKCNDDLPFMGIIVGVERNGKLKVKLEDDTFSTFDIREIQMLY